MPWSLRAHATEEQEELGLDIPGRDDEDECDGQGNHERGSSPDRASAWMDRGDGQTALSGATVRWSRPHARQLPDASMRVRAGAVANIGYKLRMADTSPTSWMAGLRALLIDLDGVMYRGEAPLPAAS